MNDPWTEEPARPEGREPAITAPPSALWLAGSLVAAYLFQTTLASPGLIDALVYAPDPGPVSRPLTLFTAIWLHGGWGHLWMNAAFALAFATPIARVLGARARATAALFLFFLACGAVGNRGVGLIHAGVCHLSLPESARAQIAWEAHLVGFAAGLALLRPIAALAGAR